MSEFVGVNTAELAGQALDWAVAEAQEIKNKLVIDDGFGGKCVLIVNDGRRKPLGSGARYSKVEITLSWFGLVKTTREILLGWAFEPTLCWANLREHLVSLTAPQADGGLWTAHIAGVSMSGNDIGPAVCRAIVAAKLGGMVLVPKELVGGEQWCTDKQQR